MKFHALIKTKKKGKGPAKKQEKMVDRNQKVKVNLSINTGINTSINTGINMGINTGVDIKRIMSLTKGIGMKLVVGTELAMGAGIKNTVKMVNINIQTPNLLRSPMKGFLIKTKPSHHPVLKQHQS